MTTRWCPAPATALAASPPASRWPPSVPRARSEAGTGAEPPHAWAGRPRCTPALHAPPARSRRTHCLASRFPRHCLRDAMPPSPPRLKGKPHAPHASPRGSSPRHSPPPQGGDFRLRGCIPHTHILAAALKSHISNSAQYLENKCCDNYYTRI